MNCPICGNVNQEGSQFCVNCGTSLTATPYQQPAAAQPAQATPVLPAQAQAQPAQAQPVQGSQIPQAAPVYQTQNAGYQQATQQQYAQPTYAQPTYAQTDQAGNPIVMQSDGTYAYALSEQDKTLRLINFILCVVTTVCMSWTIICLAWMIPMTVHSWGIYKGTKANTTAFGVCTLIFITLIGGILLLVSKKEK